MHVPLRFTALPVAIAGLLATSCGDDSSGPTPPEDDPQSVVVTVSTTGEDPDGDGYTVSMGQRSMSVQPSGSVTFEDVDPGSYEVRLNGVAENCDVEGGDSRTVTVTSSAGAQVAFAVTCERILDEFATIACPALSLASTSAQPLESVAIGRLPAELGATPWARVTWGGGEETTPALVQTEEDGAAHLTVPVHPSGDVAGGEVTFRFTDGEQACPPADFRIDALPPAEGAVDQAVEGLRAMVAERAAAFEVTTADLEAEDPATISPSLLPLAVVHSILSDDGPGSLQALVVGLPPEAKSILDALLGTLDLDLSGESGPAALGELSADEPLVDCDEEVIDAATLSDCMTKPENQNHPFPDQLQEHLNALTGLLWQAYVAIGTGELGDAADQAGAVVGVVEEVYKKLWEAAAAQLPTEVADFRITDFTGSFPEDAPENGSWKAELTATSEGFFFSTSDFSLDDLPDQVRAFLLQTGFPETQIQGQVAEALRTDLVKALASGGGDITIEPRTFGPVDVSEAAWSTDDLVEGNSVEMLAHGSYKAVGKGTSTIEVAIKSEFFGDQDAKTQFDVTVEEIAITLVPGNVWLEPSESIVFQVEVENSAFPHMVRLADDAAALQGEAFLTAQEGQPVTVLYRAPDDPTFEFVDHLPVKHTATTGARGAGSPERRGTASIHYGKLTILPPSTSCLDPGGSVDLEAELVGEGLEEVTVTWADGTDGALVESTGATTASLTAPTEGGSVTVTASVGGEQYNGLDDEITLQVGSCSCYWSVTLGGSTVEGMPGDTLGFQEDGTPQLAWIEIDHLPVPNPLGRWDLIVTRHEGLVPPGPGTYDGDVTGGIGVAGDEVLYRTWYPGFSWTKPPDPPPVATAVLFIDEYVPGRALRGAVDGFVNVEAEPQDGQRVFTRTLVPFHATFAIQVPEGSGSFGRFTCTIGEGEG